MTSQEPSETAKASTPALKMSLSDWSVLSAAILAPATLTILVPVSHYCILPLMDEFRADRGTVMFYLALGVLGQNLLAPVIGRVLTKVAPWLVMIAGAVIGAAGLFLCSIAPSLIFVALGFFITVAIGATLSGPVAGSSPLASQTIIAQRFPRIMGRAVAAQGFVQSVMSVGMPLVVAPFLTANGWRVTLGAYALVVLAYTLTMVLLFLRNAVPAAPPAGQPDPAANRGEAQSAAHDHHAAPTTRQILLSPSFWLLLLAIEPLALVVGGISPNIIPFFHDRGISVDDAKYTLAMLAAASGIGALLGGFVVDRIGPWVYLAVVATVGFLSMGALSLNVLDPAVPFITLIISVSGLGAILIVSISRLFGTAAFAPVMGLLTPFMMGSAFAGAFTGWMRDQLGSYQIVFGIMAVVLLISLLAAFLLFGAKNVGYKVARVGAQNG